MANNVLIIFFIIFNLFRLFNGSRQTSNQKLVIRGMNNVFCTKELDRIAPKILALSLYPGYKNINVKNLQ